MTYKRVVRAPQHKLANKNGFVRRSRFVLYEKLNGVAGLCHWCLCSLTWETLCADHLDSNIENDVPENLVGSCRGCNANREDGTGQGRKKPKTCSVCGKDFISKSHHKRQLFCSNECARKRRPKRGINSKHGTRSRYVQGCRCVECTRANATYSQIRYKTSWNQQQSKHF